MKYEFNGLGGVLTPTITSGAGFTGSYMTFISVIHTENGEKNSFHIKTIQSDSPDRDKYISTAHLISAAPHLLQAAIKVEELLIHVIPNDLESGDLLGKSIKLLQTAIHKALNIEG